MFEAKDVIGEAVGRTLDLLRKHSRGDTVSWVSIEVVGFIRYTEHWNQFLRRVRRQFLDATGIRLKAVQSVGLHLQTVAEQLEDQDRVRRASRQLVRRVRELNAIPNADLSDRQRADRVRKVLAAREARRSALRASRAKAVLLSHGEPTRVRPTPAA